MVLEKIRLINMLNSNAASSTKFIVVQMTRSILKYVDILYKEGVILSFSVKGDNVVIATNTSNYFFVNDQISLLSKKRTKNNKKYKDLIKYSFGLQSLYLSTSRGVLSLKNTKNKFLGGYPFVLI
jgi:ribosomal protein S8